MGRKWRVTKKLQPRGKPSNAESNGSGGGKSLKIGEPEEGGSRRKRLKEKSISKLPSEKLSGVGQFAYGMIEEVCNTVISKKDGLVRTLSVTEDWLCKSEDELNKLLKAIFTKCLREGKVQFIGGKGQDLTSAEPSRKDQAHQRSGNDTSKGFHKKKNKKGGRSPRGGRKRRKQGRSRLGDRAGSFDAGGREGRDNCSTQNPVGPGGCGSSAL